MATNNAEIGRINQSALDQELTRWIEQDNLKVEGHPKEKEYEILSKQAKATLQRMSLALTMPAGFPILEQGAEQVNKLYDEAVRLRATIAHDKIRESFGVKDGQTIEEVLEPEIERVTESLGAGFGDSIQKDLKQLVQAFEVNPAENLDNKVAGNKFFTSYNGKAGVNFDEVDKARETLKKMRAAGVASLELVSLADKLETGLREVEGVDLKGSLHHKWYEETFAGKKIDTKPLRILGGLLGAVITTIGLGQTAFSKDHALSPATVGWGLATMFMVNPNLLASGGVRALDTIAALGSKHVHEVVALGFKGVAGREALEELQDIRKNNLANLKALQKSDKPINMAQLGMLTEDPNSPLLKILSKMPEDKRAIALQTFGKSMTDEEKEFTGKMIEARV